MFQGGGVPRWGSIFSLGLVMVETFLVSLSLRWGFDDDDDRGGLGFYAGQLALESAIGGVGAAGATANGLGRGTGPDDSRDRHRTCCPGTDNTHGLAAVARQPTPRKKKENSDTEKPSGCMEAYRSVSLFPPYLASVQWSRQAAGPGRTPSERTTDGDGGRDGDGTNFHTPLVPWPGLGGWRGTGGRDWWEAR